MRLIFITTTLAQFVRGSDSDSGSGRGSGWDSDRDSDRGSVRDRTATGSLEDSGPRQRQETEPF